MHAEALQVGVGISQNELVEQHALLVKRIAYHLISRLPANIEVDDLIQAGMIGLLEASSNYMPSKGANFETYAGIRIRGAMLDEVRRADWTPRSVHQKLRKVTKAINELEASTGRDARDEEVAEAMGLSLDEYHHILRDATSCRLFSLDQRRDDDGPMFDPAGEIEPSPFNGVANEAFKHALADAIKGLPEREQLVVSLYYDEELNLREIGEVLGVSESRVCQIHSQVMARLRARMSHWTQND